MDDVADRRGSNVSIDYAKEVIERLSRDYAALNDAVVMAVIAAKDLLSRIPQVNDDQDASLLTEAIRRDRDLKSRIEGIRILEKEPLFRGAQAVDQFCFGMEEQLERRNKTDVAGVIDLLKERLHEYNQRRLMEERRRREEAARIAREAEERARAEREEAQRRQREAEERAARARKQESIEAAEKAAREAEKIAAEASKAEDAERTRRQEAEAAAAAKSADLVRERHGSGALNTMRQEPSVRITDRDALPKDVLWPFIRDDHLLMAVKAWAKVTQHKRQIPGAIVALVDQTVVQ